LIDKSGRIAVAYVWVVINKDNLETNIKSLLSERWWGVVIRRSEAKGVAAAHPSADVECELWSLNALCVGNRNIVRFARAENLKPGSIESTDGGDGRFHWTKTVLADAIAEITHSECISRGKLNFEYSGP